MNEKLKYFTYSQNSLNTYKSCPFKFKYKYIDNINVFVTYKNFQELEKELMKIVKQKDNEALKKFEEEEFE